MLKPPSEFFMDKYLIGNRLLKKQPKEAENYLIARTFEYQMMITNVIKKITDMIL